MAQPSSVIPSRSSSHPLPQVSLAAAQVPYPVHEPLHDSLPAVAHTVVHPREVPSTQKNPSSEVPSRSSSQPLQISGPLQVDKAVQLPLQVWVPGEPQVVVHAGVAPWRQKNP